MNKVLDVGTSRRTQVTRPAKQYSFARTLDRVGPDHVACGRTKWRFAVAEEGVDLGSIERIYGNVPHLCQSKKLVVMVVNRL